MQGRYLLEKLFRNIDQSKALIVYQLIFSFSNDIRLDRAVRLYRYLFVSIYLMYALTLPSIIDLSRKENSLYVSLPSTRFQ